MGNLIPPGYAELSLYWDLTNDPEKMVTTIGMALNDVPTEAEVRTLIGQWATNISDASIGTGMVMQRGRLALGQDGGPPVYIPAVGTSACTGSGGALVPQNTAYLIHKSSGLGGRANQGRMYIPGVPESKVDNIGIVLGTTVTNLNTGMANLLAAVPAWADDYVILHSADSPVETPTPITTMLCDPIAATQRRRLRR